MPLNANAASIHAHAHRPLFLSLATSTVTVAVRCATRNVKSKLHLLGFCILNCGLAGFEKEVKKRTENGKKRRKKRGEEERKEKSRIEIPKENPNYKNKNKIKPHLLFFNFFTILKNI